MVSTSVCCINKDSYGLSCTFCGKCGRKFTNNGIDDSEVVNKKVSKYSNFLKSDLYKEIQKLE